MFNEKLSFQRVFKIDFDELALVLLERDLN